MCDFQPAAAATEESRQQQPTKTKYIYKKKNDSVVLFIYILYILFLPDVQLFMRKWTEESQSDDDDVRERIPYTYKIYMNAIFRCVDWI